MNQGGNNRMRINVARNRFRGPVAVRAEGDLKGISIPAVTVPEDENEAVMVVTADSGSDEGDRAIRLVASGGGARSDAPATVVVKGLPRVLAMAVPERIEVNQDGRNRMKVRIARVRLDGPVTIRARDTPTGVTIGEVTLGPSQTEAEIEVSAKSDAPAGNRSCTLVASTDGGRAESVFELQVNELAQVAEAGWSWWMVLLIGLWTALLTVGLALALVAMQNRYLRRPLFGGSQLPLLIGGGAVVGLLSGGTGQSLLMLLTMADLLPKVGFVIGWVLLGSLLGYGLSHFIPNLHKLKASLAGAVGGLAGSLAFVLVTLFAGDIAGRFLGALLLGLSIGLMVALVELAFRQAWVEVRYGSSEMVTVNLGPEPVKVGSDSRACAIYARNAPPIAFRYWLEQGKVLCEDVLKKTTSQMSANQSQEIGAVTVTVRAGSQAASTSSSSTSMGAGHARPIAPPPPAKKTATPQPASSTGRPQSPATPKSTLGSGTTAGGKTAGGKLKPPPGPPKKRTQ